ncbi:hypothetical protein D3C76_36770 [compost metagenome]
MNHLILAAGMWTGPKTNVLLDLPMDTDVLDRVGNMDATLIGYATPSAGIEQVDGRGALRISPSKGVTFNVKSGGKRLFAQKSWTLEFDIKYIDVTTFRHDAIMAARKASSLSTYTLYIWNRQQTGNIMIVNTGASTNESFPVLREIAAPANNVWYKYRYEYDQTTKVLAMYKDDVLQQQAVVNEDFASDRFELIAVSANYFNGWLRDIKITGTD